MSRYLCPIFRSSLRLLFREEKIKTMVDDIMEKLPDPFNMIEIMGKVEERTPYVIVAFQVCTVYVGYFKYSL